MGEEWKLNRLLGERIRENRKSRGLSLARLAECLGISSQQLQKIEKGVNRASAARLFLLAEYLETPVESFLESLRERK